MPEVNNIDGKTVILFTGLIINKKIVLGANFID